MVIDKIMVNSLHRTQLLFCFLDIFRSTVSLEIDWLSVPGLVLEGDNVTLSCHYNVSADKLSELDIKWYLDAAPAPWLVHLPHHWTRAHLLPDSVVRPHVARVESNQSVTVVRLGGVTRELAGVYSCKVSTNTQELVSRARLSVVGKPKNASVSVVVDTSSRIELACGVAVAGSSAAAGLVMSLHIDGAAVATAHNSTRVTAPVYKYYLRQHPTIAVTCFVSLTAVNYTASLSRHFTFNITSPASSSSPLAVPLTSSADNINNHNLLICLLSVTLRLLIPSDC